MEVNDMKCEIKQGSCGPSDCGAPRKFWTKDEQVEMLKEYKEALDKEATGVTERIADLEKN